MILDQNLIFSDSQAVTADAPSTNSIDLGPVGKTGFGGKQLKRYLGKAKVTPLLIQVVEDFATCTSVTFQVQSAVDAAFTAPKNIVEETILLANLKVGKKCEGIQELPIIKERYVRINYVVNGPDATAGKITAAIVGAVGDA